MNLGTAQVIRANSRHLPLADNSVDLVVTSPPYFALRSYQDGGEHYAGQIGDEPTPAEFVDSLLEVTAECVRVLKPSGSLWVNLGDSYAGSGKGGNTSLANSDKYLEKRAEGYHPCASAETASVETSATESATTSTKDSVAPASKPTRGKRPRRQAERMTRADAAWLAGVIDSDGSVSIHINKQPEGRAPSFVAWTRIGQMRPEVVQRAAELTGIGQVYKDARGVWNWSASAQQARWVLERIHPWLLIKQRQAAAAIELARHVEDRNGRGAYRPLTVDDIAYRHLLREAVLTWNKGEDFTLDVPEPRKVALPDYPNEPRPKSLIGIPWRYALRCIDDLGLILRAEVIWSKPNGLPESVTDRVRRSHETWFHFTLQPRYFSAVDEIREEYSENKPWGTRRQATTYEGASRTAHGGISREGADLHKENPLGKLPGSVWTIPTEPLKIPDHLGIDHFAAFPTEWPKRIIQGWSPAGVCVECGEGRRPVVEKSYSPGPNNPSGQALGNTHKRSGSIPNGTTLQMQVTTEIVGETCACATGTASTSAATIATNPTATVRDGMEPASSIAPVRTMLPPTRPAVILDPFGGTGTTAMVAKALGRHGISVDMSQDYCRLAEWRTNDRNQLAKVLGVAKADAPDADQLDLFGGEVA